MRTAERMLAETWEHACAWLWRLCRGLSIQAWIHSIP